VQLALEAVSLHASVIHEPLALRVGTPVDRLVQNGLYKMLTGRINEFMLFFNHLKDPG